jgi:cytochrome P450
MRVIARIMVSSPRARKRREDEADMNELRDIPRVPGHPLFGNLFEIRRDRVGFLTTVNARHGAVARARHGIFDVLVSADADFTHEVLVEHADAFAKGYGLSVFMRPMLGNGLLTSEGSFHKKQRKMMSPAFAHRRIAEYAAAITERTARAEARWRDGERIDLAEEMVRLTLEIVGKTLFDAEVGSEAAAVGEAITEAMKAAIGNINAIIPLPPSIPTPRNLRARKFVAELDRVIYGLIRARRADGKDHGDFLSMLLLAQDEDDRSVMTDKQVRDEAMTIFLAGHETTANALAWTFYLLAQHPEARRRLEREVDATLGGRAPALEDLAKLPYALAVFKEAMRLYPPAYLVTRRALRPVTIRGHELRKGQLVLINIVGMQRSDRYFEEPMRFDPERFLGDREKSLNKRAYVPFAAGPRVCIGNHFALMEGQLAVTTIAQRARLELPAGSARVDPEPLVTLRPKGGMPMIVRRRAPAQKVAYGAGAGEATIGG